MDPLRQLFQEEARQHLGELEAALMRLEQGSDDADRDQACRHLHTLKGLCRLNGMEAAADWVHRVEDAVITRPDAGTWTALLDQLPALQTAIDHFCEDQPWALPELQPPLVAARQDEETLPALPALSSRELPGYMTGPEQLRLREYLTDPELVLWELAYSGPAETLIDLLNHLEPLGDVYEYLVLYQFTPPRLEALLLTPRDRAPSDLTLPDGVECLLCTRRWPPDQDQPSAPDAPATTGQDSPAGTEAPAEEASAPAASKAEAFQARLKALRLEFARDKSLELEETINQILQLSQPDSGAALDEVFRQFHSLKGAGGTHGLQPVTTLSHAVETLLARVRDGELTLSERHVDLLVSAADTLRAMLDAAAGDQPCPQAPADLIQALEQAAAELSSPARKHAPQPREPEPKPAPDATPASGTAAPPDRTPCSPAPAREVPAEVLVRIPLSRVDTLINLTGELSQVQTSQAHLQGALRQLARKLDNAGHLWRQLDSQHDLSPELRYQLMQTLGRRLQETTRIAGQLAQDTETLADAGMQHTDRLISEALSLRAVSVDQLFSQLPRLVRDTARQTGKQVTLETQANAAEVDTHVLERLREPLIHMVRNAIDHGIETAEERKALGKPEQATLRISAHSQGSRVLMRIEDDGRGLDARILKDKALAKGLIQADDAQRMTPEQAWQLIFLPGFSTRDQASQVSGRGVGMDVVRHAVESLGGHIRIQSTPGQGTAFELVLPVNLSISPVILLRAGGLTCAIPKDRIEHLLKPDPTDIHTANGRPALTRDGQALPLYRLDDMLGESGRPDLPPFVLVVHSVDGPMGVLVDAILDEQWVMIRPFEGLIAELPGYAGGCISPDGQVIPILDLNALLPRARHIRTQPGSTITKADRRPTLLVAEDSLMTQQLYRSVLEGAGFRVIVADHGLDAWKILQDETVDLVISDIQMPEMNGLELTRLIRKDTRLRHLPVILITSLENDAEREAGLEAGADAYLFKSRFLQTELLERIRLLTGEVST